MRTFPIGGIHPHDNKEWSKDKGIEVLELPNEVMIPMIQHIGAPAAYRPDYRLRIGKHTLTYFGYGDLY